MPYKLRKAPGRDLYWVVNAETGKKYSKDPIPKDKAKSQLKLLRQLKGGAEPVLPDFSEKSIEVQEDTQNYVPAYTPLQATPIIPGKSEVDQLLTPEDAHRIEIQGGGAKRSGEMWPFGPPISTISMKPILPTLEKVSALRKGSALRESYEYMDEKANSLVSFKVM